MSLKTWWYHKKKLHNFTVQRDYMVVTNLLVGNLVLNDVNFNSTSSSSNKLNKVITQQIPLSVELQFPLVSINASIINSIQLSIWQLLSSLFWKKRKKNDMIKKWNGWNQLSCDREWQLVAFHPTWKHLRNFSVGNGAWNSSVGY